MSHDDFLEPGETGLEHVTVRELSESDLDAVARIDRKITGRSRHDYFQKKIEEARRDTGIRISLAAEIEGAVAGFVLGRMYYGEFGLPEPFAIIDTIGVDPDYRGRKVGTALFDQLERNLRALGVERIQTEVDWMLQDLIGFLARMGFKPAPAICLQKSLSA